MTKLVKALVGAGTLLSFAFGASAYAGVFDSGTVDFQYYAFGGAYNADGSPATIAAPGSAQFGLGEGYFNVAVSGNHITYTYLSQVDWKDLTVSLDTGGLFIENGSLISSVSGIPDFTSVTLDPSSILGSSGFDASDITWNSGAVAVNWAGLTFADGATVVLDVNGTGGVPEPSTWALMLLGFTGLSLAAYRNSKTIRADRVAA